MESRSCPVRVDFKLMEARIRGNGGRLRPKNGSGPEWSNHFVVAHVNHPDIAVGAGAITGNGEDDATIVGSGNASRTEGFETTLLFFHFGWRAAGTPLSSRSRNFKSQIWFSMSGLWRIECPPSRPHPISPVGREEGARRVRRSFSEGGRVGVGSVRQTSSNRHSTPNS